MLRGLRFAAYLLTAFLTISVWHPGAVAQDLTPFITDELASANPSVHAPIFIRFSLKNGLPFDLVIDEVQNGNGPKGFRAKLTRPDWRIEDGPERSVSELWAHRTVSVPPSGSYSVLLPVSRWFDFDVPGRYTLEIEYTRPFVSDGRLPFPLPPGHRMVIDVAPRDAAGLQRICSDLENKSMELPTSAESYESAATLSHIKDPVAVPFLARLLAAREKMAPGLVGGLEAIADEAAVDALISFANDELEERRLLARGGLARIEAKTKDAMIRLKIEQALK